MQARPYRQGCGSMRINLLTDLSFIDFRPREMRHQFNLLPVVLGDEYRCQRCDKLEICVDWLARGLIHLTPLVLDNFQD
jgi:hypothetical protein